MNILSQIMKNESKSFIINQLKYNFKIKFSDLMDNFNYNNNNNRFTNFILELQKFMNDLTSNFLVTYFETLDFEFKNSKERKEKYFINKSNVERTIITIFGTITFKRTLYQHKLTNEYYFYLDDLIGLEAYKNYDPIIRAILVQDSVLTNPNHISLYSSLNVLNLSNYLENYLSIPKQTIYKFKQETKINKIDYDEIPHEKNLYVMVDEKWIHEQDKNNPKQRKYIMAKCFVTFTGIKRKGKRSRLVGRHIFITSSNKPWKEFVEEISNIYNFEKLENINLLSDAGSWILSGAYELKLYTNNKIKINTCEFHVKQKINRSTTDKDLRVKIANIIYENEDKKLFIKEMDKLIESKTKDTRKQKITEYKNYILRHWKGIINMKYSLCKSSMEAHIEHCIASIFSSVPKAYSSKNIENYLKLQEMMLNGVNIFNYYINSYNSKDNVNSNEKEVDISTFFEKTTSSNIIPLSSKHSISYGLHGIAHSFS